MDEINYSIIIPHKNIPKLLQRCLDSIPQRSDIQIIVVDDNSNLENINLPNFPGLHKKGTNVYFTKEGKGAGYARNVGLEHATGKWLLFADADDFFYKDFITKCDAYRDSNYDIIYFNLNSVDSDTLEPSENRLPYLERLLQNNDTENLRYRSAVPYGKMIKHSLVVKNKIKFNEIIVANDVWFSSQVGYFAKNIKTDLNILYCVTARSGSLYYHMTKERRIIRFNESMRVNQFLYDIGKRQYRTEPLIYFIPLPFHFKHILPARFLYKYIQQENVFRVIYYSAKHILKILIKR